MTDVGPPSMRARVIRLCEQLGANSLLTQGGGGNVSWKENGILWVKVSGMPLKDASRDGFFIPLDYAKYAGALHSGDFSETPPVLGQYPGRPSIEASLHGIIPERIVVHLHSVDALAVLVQEAASEMVSDLFASLEGWALIPYARPGVELTRKMSASLRDRGSAWAYFLMNHGIVVGGSTIGEVEDRLSQVLERFASASSEFCAVDHLEVPVHRRVVCADIRKLEHPDLEWLVDERSREYLEANWALYPDHVVFLGGSAQVVNSWDDLRRALGGSTGKSLAIWPHEGMFVNNDWTDFAEEQLLCFAQVLKRQSSLAPLRTLSTSQVQELVNWDSEKYRIDQAHRRGNVSDQRGSTK